jgi:hypothetical protein
MISKSTLMTTVCPSWLANDRIFSGLRGSWRNCLLGREKSMEEELGMAGVEVLEEMVEQGGTEKADGGRQVWSFHEDPVAEVVEGFKALRRRGLNSEDHL